MTPRRRLNISALLLAVRQSEGCVVPECRLERDGRVIVTVDGLRVSLHRYLWVLSGRPLSWTDYLLRRCDTFGCVQPAHFECSNRPYSRDTCPNGHAYTEADTLPGGRRRCHVCAEARRARRPNRGGHPNWVLEKRRQFCPQGHPYTPENTYLEITPIGRQKRHCKTCVLARRKGLDPADVVAA